MASEAAFWEWSLARWREEGVEAQLLKLQDVHELVVLEVLMGAWLGTLGVHLSQADWQAMIDAADPWVEGVVLPLRQRRILWRAQPAQAGLYSEVKKLELSAERSLASIYVEALANARDDLAPAAGGADGKALAREAVAANLTQVLSRAQPAVGPEVVACVTELLAP